MTMNMPNNNMSFIFEKMTLTEIREKNYPDIPETIFYAVMSADPTWNEKLREKDFGGQFARYLIDRYKASPDGFSGAITEWRESLTTYLELKKEKRIPANDNIMDYKSVTDLQDLFTMVDGNSFDVIYQDAHLVLVHPLTKTASCLLGRVFKGDNAWCTAWPGGTYYDHYAPHGYLIIAIKGDNEKVPLTSPQGVMTKDKAQFYANKNGEDMEIEAYNKKQITLEQWESYIAGPAREAWLSWLTGKGIEYDSMQYRDIDYIKWTRDLETGETVEKTTRPTPDYDEDDDEDDDEVEEVETTQYVLAETHQGTCRVSYGEHHTYEGDPDRDSDEEFDYASFRFQAIGDDTEDSIFYDIGEDVLKELDISPYCTGCYVGDMNDSDASAFFDFIRFYEHADDFDTTFPWEGECYLLRIPSSTYLEQNIDHIMRDFQFVRDCLGNDPQYKIVGNYLYIWDGLYSFVEGAQAAVLSHDTNMVSLWERYVAQSGYEFAKDLDINGVGAMLKGSEVRIVSEASDLVLKLMSSSKDDAMELWKTKLLVDSYSGEDKDEQLGFFGRDRYNSHVAELVSGPEFSESVSIVTIDDFVDLLYGTLGTVAGGIDLLVPAAQGLVSLIGEGKLPRGFGLKAYSNDKDVSAQDLLGYLSRSMNAVGFKTDITQYRGAVGCPAILAVYRPDELRQRASASIARADLVCDTPELREAAGLPKWHQRVPEEIRLEVQAALVDIAQIYQVNTTMKELLTVLPPGPAYDFVLKQDKLARGLPVD